MRAKSVFTFRRQVCKCWCFNCDNVINSERDDRLGSLEVSAVAVVGNLRSTVLLRTSRNDRVGDRGTPEVEGQDKGSVESSEKACCESEQSPSKRVIPFAMWKGVAGLNHQHQAMFGR